MPIISDLRNELNQAETLRTVTSTFEEIAATRINKLRDSFEQNSLFFEEISQLYHSVKLSAAIQKMKIAQKNAVKPKTAHVAITSNHHFYGTLNVDIINRFYEEVKNSTATHVVVGTTGREYLASYEVTFSCETVDFAKDTPTDVELRAFLTQFHDYDRILLYYPKFISMLSQKVDILDITHSPTDIFLPQSRRDVRFIFEPELPKIVEFFETQVRLLLFWRVMLETELSRTASRLVSMNISSRRASDLITETRGLINRVQHSAINAELIETFGKIKIWKKTS